MLGLGVRLSSHGTDRWRVSAVLVDPDDAAATECFVHECDGGGDAAVRGKELGHWIETTILTPHPNLVSAVLFESDYSAQGARQQGTKNRLRLEGAAIAALAKTVRRVAIKDGRGLGAVIGGGKPGAIAQGAALGLGADYNDAAAAALTAAALAI